MQNQDKQYYIDLRFIKERIPCTKDKFNAYRRIQINYGLFVCPPYEWLNCDKD